MVRGLLTLGRSFRGPYYPKNEPDELEVIIKANYNRGVSRIFIIGFPTSGVRRYFNRGGEATS